MVETQNLRRFVVGTIGTILAASAVGNGINPPRPADSRPLEANCIGWDGQKRTFARASLDSPKGNRLAIKDADGVTMLPIQDVATLAIQKRPRTKSTEVEARLLRRGATVDEATRVIIAMEGTSVRIKGFAGKTAETLPLAACRTVTFSLQADACQNERMASPSSAKTSPNGEAKSQSPTEVAKSTDEVISAPTRPADCPPTEEPRVQRVGS